LFLKKCIINGVNKIMSKRILNQDQIECLLKSGHVSNCSPTQISYSKEFKILAVRQYDEGKTPTQIFREAGLDPDLVGKYVPDNCLRRWRRKLEAKGEAGLMADGRGLVQGARRGRPKTKGLTDAERIKRLEIENAYLKAKYDFLVKLRAQGKR
jgi:transposase